MGITEIVLILISVMVFIVIGNYGRDTRLGYTGSVLLCFIISPIFVYLILAWMKHNEAEKSRQKRLW